MSEPLRFPRPSRRVVVRRSVQPLRWRPDSWQERLDAWLWRHRITDWLLRALAIAILAAAGAFLALWAAGSWPIK